MQEIELTKGYKALVDDEIFPELDKYNWHVLDSHKTHRYAARWKPKGFFDLERQVLRMHHVVLNITAEYLNQHNLVVDHIDRNGLNNTKENLRIVSRSINAINCTRWDNSTWIRWDCVRGQYKVVHKDGSFIKWCHTITEAIEVRDAHH